MLKLKRTSGILVPRDYENTDFYELIIRRLTRRAKSYQNSSFEIYRFFLEGPNFLTIPRYFPINEISKYIEVIDHINPGEDIKINHNITLRDELQKNVVEYFLNNRNGILQAVPGSGKTVTSIYNIAERKKKTLILVHRDGLADQWKGPGTPEKPQGLLAFTDLNDNDIARLTSSNYKKAFTKPIIIATDQTIISLLKRDRLSFLTELRNANIGMLIGDEVHTTVGAPTFAECSIHVAAPVTFGLSATPYRYDGNGDIIEWHLGNVFVPEGKASVMDAVVNVLMFDFEIINDIEEKKNRYTYIYWADEFQRSRYLNMHKNSKPLIRTCTGLIKKFIVDRNIILISERINFIELLFKMSKDIESKSIFAGSAKIGVLEEDFVLATPGKIRDGIDIPKKDCLIITSPISNIEQLCGRVVRTSVGKKEPIVVDMVDLGCNDIKRTIHARLKYYDSKNWRIRFMTISRDGKIVEVSRDDAMRGLSED